MTTRWTAWRSVCWFALLSVPAAVAAYYRSFLGFSRWDDEGTEMATVKQHLSGAKLYEEVFSPYGPVYYFYHWLLHSVLGLALSHNVVRITSAVLVLVCALGCAWIVFRFTKSLAAATIVHLAVYRGLRFFGNEPGHPQELCLVLTLGLVASGILAGSERWRLVGVLAAGSLAASLLLIKINIGIFAIVAVTLAVLVQAPAGRLPRMAYFASAAAAIAMPFLLMRSHLDDPAEQAYCFIVTVSIVALLIAQFGSDWDGWFTYSQCWAALAAFAVTVGVALAVLAMQGVPMAQVLNMLVLKHLKTSVQQRQYYFALNMGWDWTLRLWMAWALAGLCAAVACARGRRGKVAARRDLLAPARFLFGGIGLMAATVLPKVLIALVTPFCWLLLYPPENTNWLPPRARMLLCTLAAMQTLIAYPIAGSQMYFIRILLMVVATVAMVDGLRGLQPASVWGAWSRRFAGPIGTVVLVCVGVAYPVMAFRAKAAYASFEPLGLPGAERIHVARQARDEYHWLVGNLDRYCDTFVGLPQFPSLYFWTGKPLPGPVHEAPGGLSMDAWMLTHSAEEQRAIVSDLDRHPDACAIYSPEGVFFWYKKHTDFSDSPLATYIFTRFKRVDQMGDFQFMVRRERQFVEGTYGH